MCEFVAQDEPAVVERQIAWSPASCEVKVNRLSCGPRVRTTLWLVASSYGGCMRLVRGVWEKALDTHVYFDKDSQVRILDVFLLAVRPLEGLIVTWITD